MMKKLLLAVLFAPLVALGQSFTYPSVTFQNLTVLGTFSGSSINLGPQAANSVLANATGSSAAPLPFVMPSCSTPSSALQWTSGSGFSCNTAIAASTATSAISANSASTSTTQSIGNNSTNIATTAFVAKRGCPNIMDYGGDNTGTNDNSSAWSNTIAASPNTSAATCVYFPPGKYKFTGAISYTLPSSGIGSITVMGAGLDNTILYWPSGNGMQINFPSGRVSAHVQDLSITTGTTNTGTGLAYVATAAVSDPASTPGSTITNVAVRGDDGYVGGAYADYWQYGVLNEGVTYLAVYNLNTFGTPAHVGVGFLIEGFGTSYAAATAINSSNFTTQNYGIVYGSYVQGVTVFQSSFAGDEIGIASLASETGILDGLLVTGSEFATHQFGILTNTAIGNTQIIGNAFQNLDASGVNIDLNPSNVFIVVGNIVECGLVTGPTYGVIAAGSSAGGGMISGNEFSLCGVGVNLGAGTSAINVQSNYYLSNTTNTANAGAGNTIGGGSP